MEVAPKHYRRFRDSRICGDCDTEWTGSLTACPQCQSPWRKKTNWSFITELVLVAIAAGILIWFTAYS